MSEEPFDRELKRHFQKLREEDAARTPDFETMLARAQLDAERVAKGATVEAGTTVGAGAPGASSAERESVVAIPMPDARGPGESRRARRAQQGRWVLLAGTGLAAVLAALTLIPADADDEFDALVTAFSAEAGLHAWRSPTDGLLEVPGIELVRSVPSIGLPPVGTPDPDGGPPSDDNG